MTIGIKQALVVDHQSWNAMKILCDLSFSLWIINDFLNVVALDVKFVTAIRFHSLNRKSEKGAIVFYFFSG